MLDVTELMPRSGHPIRELEPTLWVLIREGSPRRRSNVYEIHPTSATAVYARFMISCTRKTGKIRSNRR